MNPPLWLGLRIAFFECLIIGATAAPSSGRMDIILVNFSQLMKRDPIDHVDHDTLSHHRQLRGNKKQTKTVSRTLLAAIDRSDEKVWRKENVGRNVASREVVGSTGWCAPKVTKLFRSAP